MFREGVVVFNTPGANANAVKEMVICALIFWENETYLVSGNKTIDSINTEKLSDEEISKKNRRHEKGLLLVKK